MNTSRRSFLTTAAMGTVAGVVIPEIVSAAFTGTRRKKIRLDTNDVVLFQGDSITDAGRDRKRTGVNTPVAMGSGYPLIAGAELLMRHPAKNLKVFNRAISGNKVYQLAERWDADCLELKPNVLSILVGVNDYWHTLTTDYKGTPEIYRADYKKLLDRTLQVLPDVKLIIGEPYAVMGVKAVTESWYPVFNEYRAAARELAAEYGAEFIPYQSFYDEALKKAPGSYWTPDGVHPSLAGAKLMAQAWLRMVG